LLHVIALNPHTIEYALHHAARASVRRRGGAAMTILDRAMVTAVVSAIAYIAAIMMGWL